MSKTVDTRVVEMRFDNKQFENGVKTSMSTLEKLKSSLKLDGAAKGLENLDKAANSVSFDGIASGVAALEKRFSTLGIVGMRVIENLTDSAMKTLGKMTSFINEGIIQGGKNRAMNLENAHFQLQGLLQDEEAVNAVMKNVNDSVDGTAYSLDAAAKVASQFAASGMRAGNQMFSSLRAVAGVAAMTNSEYEEIGRVFTKVAGQGRLMGDDLLSLSSRGMNAAAAIRDYFNSSQENLDAFYNKYTSTAKKSNEAIQKGAAATEANVRTMVTNAAIDFETFANAMDSAFGEHAKKANETFTGAMSNIKAALARIGALFISPLVVQNGALVQLFNVIRERINDVKNSIGPLADSFVSGVTAMANALTSFLSKLNIKSPLEKISKLFTSKWSQFEKKINDVGIATEEFQSKLKEVADEHGISLDELMQKYGSLKKVISSGQISKNVIIETLKKFADIGKNVSNVGETVSSITSRLEEFNRVTGQIINGDFKNGAERVQALTDAGYEYATMQKLVNYVWERNGHTWNNCSISADELTNVLGELSQEELQSIGYTEEQAEKLRQLADEAEKTGTPLNELISKLQKPSGKELIIDSLKNALTGLSGIMKAVKKAWLEMVSPLSTSIFSSVAETINAFSKKLVLSEEKIESLKRVFKGLFAVLDMIRSVVAGALGTAFKVVSAILNSFNISVLDAAAYVGDAVVKFRDWIREHNFLKKALDAILPVIKNVVTAIYDWAKNNEFIQNGIKKIGSLLDSASSKIGKWIDGLKEAENIPKYIVSGLVNGIKSGISTVVEVMIEFGKAILNAIKNILGIHSPSKAFFEIGRNIIDGLINGIKSGVSLLLSLLGDIGQKCVEVFNNIGFDKIFVIGIGAGLIYMANTVLKVMKMLSAPAAGIGKMTSSIGGFFDALSAQIKPNKLKNVSSAVRDFALAIGILAGSIYVLAQLDVGKMWNAVGALAALSGVITLLSIAASKINTNGGNFKQLSLMIVGISAALYLMSSAIKKLEFLNGENIAPVLGGFTAMIAGFTAILLALRVLANSPGGKDISKAGLVVLGISAAMLLMAKVVKSISGLDNGAFIKGMTCITLFGGLITGLMAATKLVGKDVGKIGTTILEISAAMLLMVSVIKSVSKLEVGALAKGITCMTLFGGLITGLIAATKLVGKDIKKIGSTILGISTAMALMALTIKIVSNMNAASIIKGVACVAAFGGIVAGLIAATRLAGGNELKGVTATLISMSIAIGILGAIAIGLSLIDMNNLAKGIVAVGMLSGMMTLMTLATKNAQDCKRNIIALTVAIGLMAGAIVALSFIDGKRLAGATTALGVVMGMFVLMEKTASSTNGVIPSILAMTVAVDLLAVMLALLAKIPSEALLASATSLSLLLLSMSASFAIISKAGKVATSAIGSLALMGLIVGELAVILGLMSKFDVKPSIETAASLSLLLVAMSASLVLLSTVGATGPAAFIGIGALAALIAAIGGLMIGIGALTKYVPGMQNWLDNGMVVLEKIGYGLGSFFGNIAGGFLGGVASGLPAIGENLSAFMESIQPFLNGISNVDSGSLESVESLVRIVLALTAADFINGLTSWLNGSSSLDEFGEKLPSFGNAIVKYSNVVAGINTSGVEASVTAGKMLAELASILPNSGGVVSWFAGNNDIDDFGEKLVSFGRTICSYCNKVNGINTSGVEASVSAGKMLTELASILPNSGGVVSWFAGNNDIDDFGEKLVSFGRTICSYCNKVNGINTSGVEASVSAGKMLAELAAILPNSGGVVSWFAGNNDIDDFGEKLVSFGKGIKSYSDKVNGINTSGVEASVTAGKMLAELASILPNSGGVVSWFAGNNDIDDFGEKLASFGKGIKSYSDKVAGIDASGVEASVSAGRMLAELASILPNSGGVVSLFAGNNDIDDFGAALEMFGGYISSYYNRINYIDGSKLIDVSSAIGISVENLKGLSGIKIPNDAFGKSLETFGACLSSYYNRVDYIDGDKLTEISEAGCKSAEILKNLSGIKVDGDTCGKSLETFGSYLSSYYNRVNYIDGGKLFEISDAGYKSAEILKNLSGINVDGELCGKSLETFGSYLSSYYNRVNYIDGSRLIEISEAGRKAAELLKDLSSIYVSGDACGKYLETFGAYLSSYYNRINYIDGDKLFKISEAGRKTAELLKDLSGINVNGDACGKYLETFGAYLSSYYNRINYVDGDRLTDITEAGRKAAELLKDLSGINVNGDACGKYLETFGAYLSSYYNRINYVDGDRLTDITEAGRKAAELLEDLSGINVNGDACGKYLETFGAYLSSYYNRISYIDSDQLLALTEAVCSVVDMINSLSNAVTEGVDTFGASMENLASIGIEKFATAFRNASPHVISVTIEMLSAIINTINNEYGNFYNTGKHVVEGFANGISENSYLAIAQATAMAKAADAAARAALGVESPSRAFMTIGRYIGEGLAIGIRNSSYKSVYETEATAKRIKEAAQKSFEDVEKWVEDAKFFDELSLAEELELWEAVISKYAEGSEERIKAEKNAYSVYKELREADYQHSVDWINKEKDYNRLSLDEEIAAWERMQSRYIEGTEERIEIDKKLYDLKHQRIDGSITLIEEEIKKQKELIATLEEGTVAYSNAVKELGYLNKLYADASYQHSEEWMDEEEAYGRLDLSSKLAARRRMLETHKDDPERTKILKREIFKIEKELNDKYKQYIKDKESIDEEYAQKRIDLEQEYYDKEQEINDKLVEDIERVNKEYEDAVQSRTDSLYSSYGLFDEVSTKDKVSANKLFRNLQDQTAEFEDWVDMLNLLKGRGLNESLVEELQEMGPSAIAQIKALNSMSDAQLAQYANLWSDKHKLAKERATDELEGLRKGTQQQIKELKEDAADELSHYKSVWEENLSELNTECDTKLKELETIFKKEVGIIKSGTEAEVSEMTTNVKSIMTEAGWDDVGEEIVNGITNGIKDKKPMLMKTVTCVATTLISCFKLPLRINSPSKVFAEFGRYIDEGLIVGIKSLFGEVADTSENLGQTTLDSIASTIGRISDMVDGDIQITPTISPIVDLSNVNRSIDRMNSGIYANRSIELGMQLREANQNDAISQMNENVSKLADVNTSSNSKLADAIDSLRNDFNTLVDTVSQMQIVMDSGALVGAITPGMDRSLGIATVMNRRGV